MRGILILTFILLAVCGYSQKEVSAVKTLMMEQQDAWNKADIEGFMEHYWKNDSLKFIGSKGITYGWQKTLDNYKKSYPDAEKMGTLTFGILSMEALSKTSVYVIGKWSLLRKENNVGGHFTLLWKKIKGNWVIVADHTG